jgi:hypothetical protein
VAPANDDRTGYSAVMATWYSVIVLSWSRLSRSLSWKSCSSRSLFGSDTRTSLVRQFARTLWSAP